MVRMDPLEIGRIYYVQGHTPVRLIKLGRKNAVVQYLATPTSGRKKPHGVKHGYGKEGKIMTIRSMCLHASLPAPKLMEYDGATMENGGSFHPLNNGGIQ